jgi:hypothetical protein
MITIIVTTIVCELLTMSFTLLNLLGVIISIEYLIISIKTKCLTNLKFKKNEKND